MDLLYKAIARIQDEKTAEDFLKDICTPQELRSLKERLKIAQMLSDGVLSYRDIQKETKASLTTIGRVARFMKDEPYKGYARVFELIKD